jgi:hypothetical protein
VVKFCFQNGCLLESDFVRLAGGQHRSPTIFFGGRGEYKSGFKKGSTDIPQNFTTHPTSFYAKTSEQTPAQQKRKKREGNKKGTRRCL